MNVFHYLDLQFEALIILLQDTHCTIAEKLVQCFLGYRGRCVPRPAAISEFPQSSDTEFIRRIFDRKGATAGELAVFFKA